MTAILAGGPRHSSAELRHVIRVAAGVPSLLAGSFWLVMALAMPDGRNIFVGAAVAAGGAVLLTCGKLRPPARLVTVVAGSAGVAATMAGLMVFRTDTGGMFGWFEHRGWPFDWLRRGAVADSPDEARRLAVAGDWDVDCFRLFADAVVWSYTALVVIVAVSLIWRAHRLRRPGVRTRAARGNGERLRPVRRRERAD